MSSVLLSGLLDRKLAGPAVREEGPEQPFRGRGVPELMAPPPWARPLFRACVQIRTQLGRSHDDKVGGPGNFAQVCTLCSRWHKYLNGLLEAI